MQAPSGAAHLGPQQTSSTRATAVDLHDMELGYMLVSITVLIVALTALALIKVAPKLYRKVIERGNQWYSFFLGSKFHGIIVQFCTVTR